MDSVWTYIIDKFKEILIGAITGNLKVIFEAINEQTASIGSDVATTPSSWNPSIWGMVSSIAETVIVPIAAIILTYIMCMELISVVQDKNNMHNSSDIISMFIKYIIKMMIAVLLVRYTHQITMGFFDLAAYAINNSAGLVDQNVNVDVGQSLEQIAETLKEEGVVYLIELTIISWVSRLCLWVMTIVIRVILLGRMVEIYMYCSFGPIPFSTLANREWSNIGQNYIKSLAALAFQGFFIFLCVGIYAVLVRDIGSSSDLNITILKIMMYSAVLCFTLLKTGTLAKSIFSAH